MGYRVLKKILLGWFLLVVLVALLGKVTVAATDAGRTAADFLKVGMGASSASMGDAYSAVAENVDAAYWNPAQLTYMSNSQVTLGHFEWYQDISVEQGAAGFNVNENLSMAFSMIYVGYGEIAATDYNGPTGEQITAYDWAAGLSAGYRLSDMFAFGLTAKYINQQLDDISAGTYAFDMGGSANFGRVTVAGVVANVGPDLEFDGVAEPLPTSARLGLAVRFFDDMLTTSVELDNQFDGDLTFRQGLQFTFDGQYYIRTGMNYIPGSFDKVSGSEAAIGAGIRMGRMQFDYSFTPDDRYTAGSLHRISLTLGVGE
ncbi:MAG TPA: PorV/PorQ family protein [candidate division Zixibacteria bacterium]|nr:PorV/PorQ family protein [candidate division Zixibacteria bacterium]